MAETPKGLFRDCHYNNMMIITNIIKYLTHISHGTKSFTHEYFYRNLTVSTAVGGALLLPLH